MAFDAAQHIQDANDVLRQAGQLERVGDNRSSNYAIHAGEHDMVAHEFIKQAVQSRRDSFEGLQVKLLILADDGEPITWQRTVTGTHRQAYPGFPATNRTLTWHDMVVSRIESGRIQEEWVVSELSEVLLRGRS